VINYSTQAKPSKSLYFMGDNVTQIMDSDLGQLRGMTSRYDEIKQLSWYIEEAMEDFNNIPILLDKLGEFH